MGGRLFTPRNVPLVRATPPVYNCYRPASRHFLSIRSSFFLRFFFCFIFSFFFFASRIAGIFVDLRGEERGIWGALNGASNFPVLAGQLLIVQFLRMGISK